MSLTNRISVIIDVTTEKAVKGLAGFKTAVKDAEGFTGKLRAGVGSLGTTFGAAAKNPAVMATAVTAVGAAALAAANEFSNTAKAAIDLGKATGLSTEAASRWIAVGDDFEVGAEALTASIGKIGKTLDGAQWDKYGVATRDAGGAARDTNAILTDALTMLSGITNATERARVGNQLFGKGFAALSPLIGHTRAEYEKMLGSVEDGQVITDAEAKKAEKWRLAMDNLQDALKEVTLAVGEMVVELAPLLEGLTDTVKGATGAVGAINDLPGAMNVAAISAALLSGNVLGLVSAIDDLADGPLPGMPGIAVKIADGFADAADNGAGLTDAFISNQRAAGDLYTDYQQLNRTLAAQRDAVDALKRSNEDLYQSQLDLIGAAHDLERQEDAVYDSIDEYNQVLTESGAASEAADDAAKDTATSMYDLAAAQSEAKNGSLDSQQAVDDMIISLELMQSTLEPGSPLYNAIQAYIDQLKKIPTNIATSLIIDARTTQGSNKKRARGGPVAAGETYLVGEEGPELVTMGGSGYVTPNNEINGALGAPVGRSAGGSPVTINVYPRTMPTTSELAEWIRSARRRGEII